VGAPGVTVELVRASTEAELAALRRLYALYLHDLSEFTSHYELDEQARWRPDYLEDMLTWQECHCLLILAGGKPAGFALVSLQPFPHMPRDVDARLAEFFVAQPYRRRGIGRGAALAALARFPGTWVLEVVTGNEAALAFWRAVTGEATDGEYAEEERPGDTVQRFTIRG
jgi:predicted acetyltransferase